MQYNYLHVSLSKNFLKKSAVFCSKSNSKVNKFFLKKKTYIRKGLYFRKIIFNKHSLGSLTSSYLISRKPFNRVPKKKRR